MNHVFFYTLPTLSVTEPKKITKLNLRQQLYNYFLGLCVPSLESVVNPLQAVRLFV